MSLDDVLAAAANDRQVVLDAYATVDTRADSLLIALAITPGVDIDSISIRSRPRRSHHGHHAVRFTQNGTNRTAEGSTLNTALRAALRAAGTVSAHPGGRT